MVVTAPALQRSALLAALALAGCYGGGEVQQDGGTTDATDAATESSPPTTPPEPTSSEADTSADESTTSADETGDAVDPCADPQAGHTPLRRLTREQYANTVHDLFGVTDTPADEFQPDERVGPFYINGVAPVAEVAVQDYLDAAESLAATIVAEHLATVLPCKPKDIGADACAAQFIAETGRKIYRRPLTAAEQTAYASLFAIGKQVNFNSGVELTLQAMLQSPHFLYIPEYGEPDPNAPLRALTGHELAARLSYFLWNTTPDDELMTAAESGVLASADGLRTQAERMLADERARKTIESFHLQWLAVDDLPEADKDPELYDFWTPKLARQMLAETARFADHVIREGDGKLSTLMTSSLTFATGELLTLLGGTVPEDHVEGAPIALDPARRHGILTHASVMARHAYAAQSSPIHRGVTVLSNVLCTELPSPPADFMVQPPEVDLSRPTRERFEQHTADPACSGCHALIDGIGFGFEHYDALGIYRTDDAGAPVDASAEVVGIADQALIGSYADAHAMIDAMVDSPQVRGCFVRQWSRFALGRIEQQADTCSVDVLRAGFDASGLDIRDLLVSLVTTDMFRLRSAAEE